MEPFQSVQCAALSFVGRAGVCSPLLPHGLRRHADAAGRSSVRAPRPVVHCAADKEGAENTKDWSITTIAHTTAQAVQAIQGGDILIARTVRRRSWRAGFSSRAAPSPKSRWRGTRLARDRPPAGPR